MNNIHIILFYFYFIIIKYINITRKGEVLKKVSRAINYSTNLKQKKNPKML